MKKKIIAFSLWGDNPKYTIGAIRNAEIALTIFPDWLCRYYVGQSVPIAIIDQLTILPNVEIARMTESGDWTGMFWRFSACSDPSVEIALSRDTDSRLSLREKQAVDEWLNSDKLFHIMRDHPYHNAPILGGLWGARNAILGTMQQMIARYEKGNFWQVDQNFLRDEIYPRVQHSTISHDEFFHYPDSEKHKFPTKRKNYHFVGEIFDENDDRHPDHWLVLRKL